MKPSPRTSFLICGFVCLAFLCLTLIRPFWISADVSVSNSSALIPFQGHLTVPVPGSPGEFRSAPDGTYTLVFAFYSSPAGGESKFWGPERHENVSVRGGLVNVLLGTRESIKGPRTVGFFEEFDRPIYVGITIDSDGKPETADLELTPRQLWLPSVFSRGAGNSGLLNGHGWSAILDNSSDPVRGDVRGAVPVGGIVPWYGNPTSLSERWRVCDGSTVTDPESPLSGLSVPDLKNRFVKGASDSSGDLRAGELVSGGSSEHSHLVSIDASGLHTHTAREAGSHAHQTTVWGDTINTHVDPSAPFGLGGAVTVRRFPTVTNSLSHQGRYHMTSSEGMHTHEIVEGGEHTHEASAEETGHEPPWVALHYIIRIK